MIWRRVSHPNFLFKALFGVKSEDQVAECWYGYNGIRGCQSVENVRNVSYSNYPVRVQHVSL
uniref:Uncharacterized protein n=1 Tax=Physcomitrium patens TaxID=3218 RepID=A0A2K1IFA4_PHYPA|nr:hypothetical protein PHYPA_028544 [Physcomitrium patens]